MPLVSRAGHWYVRIVVGGRQVWRSLHRTTKPARRDWIGVEQELWREAEAAGAQPPVARLGELGAAIASYHQHLADKGRSEGYRERVRYVLGNVRTKLVVNTLAGWTRDALERYLAAGLAGGWAGRTANLHRDIVMHFLRWCRASELLPPGPIATDRIEQASEDTRQPVVHDWRARTRILRACRDFDSRPDAWTAPWLERAVRVAIGTGARLGELQELRWSSLDFAGNRIKLWGKGRKERIIPLSPSARAALLTVPAADREGVVFPQLARKDDKSLTRALKAAGVPHCGWHSCRHTWVTELIRRGVPLPVVQAMAGHADINTTMRYIHVSGIDMVKAVAKLW